MVYWCMRRGVMYETQRSFLTDAARRRVDFSKTDQANGVAPPAQQKPVISGQEVFPLTPPGSWKGIKAVTLEQAIAGRKSHRKFLDASLTIDELSFLIHAVQGVRGRVSSVHTFRTVPSAGCRHALETYIAVHRVDLLDAGLYRYQPLDHKLVLLRRGDLRRQVAAAALGQAFAGYCAATFIWSTVPYRMEWRYGEVSHKVIAVDAGHACQNLYLACEAVSSGTCAIGAYDQELADACIDADGTDEFVIYMAPVGKVQEHTISTLD